MLLVATALAGCAEPVNVAETGDGSGEEGAAPDAGDDENTPGDDPAEDLEPTSLDDESNEDGGTGSEEDAGDGESVGDDGTDDTLTDDDESADGETAADDGGDEGDQDDAGTDESEGDGTAADEEESSDGEDATTEDSVTVEDDAAEDESAADGNETSIEETSTGGDESEGDEEAAAGNETSIGEDVEDEEDVEGNETTPTDGATDEEDSADGTEETSDAGEVDAGDEEDATPGEPTSTEWHAFDFSEPVTSTSGASGLVQGYAFTSTAVQNGNRRVFDAEVTYAGAETENVRAVRKETGANLLEPEVVENPIDLYQLTHTLTVREDALTGQSAGDTESASVYLPVDAAPYTTSFPWFLFPKLTFTSSEGEGVWEYYLTEEMKQEMQDGDADYALYHDGEYFLEWWAADAVGSWYGLMYFSSYVTGSTPFEEGTWSMERQGSTAEYTTEATTVEVSGMTFDAFHVTVVLSNAVGEVTAELTVAPELPVPYYYRIPRGDGSNEEDVSEFQLTSVTLE